MSSIYNAEIDGPFTEDESTSITEKLTDLQMQQLKSLESPVFGYGKKREIVSIEGATLSVEKIPSIFAVSKFEYIAYVNGFSAIGLTHNKSVKLAIGYAKTFSSCPF